MYSMTPEVDFRWMVGEDPAYRQAVSDLAVAPKGKAAELLALLARGAQGDPVAGNLYGVGLGVLGRGEEAIGVFRSTLAAHPRFYTARFNLARCYLDGGQRRRALQELQTASEHAEGTTDQRRIRQVLQGLTRHDAEHAQRGAYLRLRSAMLRERLGRGAAEPGDARRLGAALMELYADHQDESSLEEMVTVLERARVEDRSDSAALELLARALLASYAQERFAQVVTELEEVAPHSPFLAGIRTRLRTEQPQPDGALFQRLAQDAIGGGPEADAAMADLRALARAWPRDLNLRSALMVAAMTRGDLAEALDLAGALIAESDTHTAHFNVAQVYWANGDPERTLQHVARASELAANQDERQDVLNLITFLQERNPDG
jgi:tetratricopeptide (TPR) repeat protein